VQGRTALAIGAAGLVGLSALAITAVALSSDDDELPAAEEPAPDRPRADEEAADEQGFEEVVGAVVEQIGAATLEGIDGALQPAYDYHDEISRIAVATQRSPRDAEVVREAFVNLRTTYASAVLFEGPPVETATQADWEAAQWRFIVTNPLGPALCVEVSLDTGPVETSEQLLAIGCRAPGTLVE